MSTHATRDQSYIDTIAHYTNKRQAAKIRDTTTTHTLHATHPTGNRDYWLRGHPHGVYVLGKTNGAIHLSRLLSPGQLSGMLAAATSVAVLRDRADLPRGILRMRGGDRG